MKFFVILTCLALERFFSVEKFLKRDKVFQFYFRQVSKLAPLEWQNSPYGLLVFLLPLEAILFVLYFFIQHYFSWFSAFLANVVLLLYCLGPINIYHIASPIPQDLFEKIHRSLFSTLFWFALLGPLGGVLYRVLERITTIPEDETLLPDIKAHIISTAYPLLGYLTWLPLRLFNAIQILVGKMPNAFNYWLDHLIVNWDQNNRLAAESGRLSLGLTLDAQLSSDQYIQALQLLDRVLVLFSGIIFIRSLIGWIM